MADEARRKRRSLSRWGWLLAAVLLFAVASLLMRGPEPEKKSVRAERVHVPNHMTREDRARLQTRLRPSPVIPDAGSAEAPLRDPLLAILPSARQSRLAIVIEANAIRHSALGERLLECFGAEGERMLEQMKNELGVDPLQDLDRVAVIENGLILSGNFASLKLDRLPEVRAAESYGDHGRIFQSGHEKVAVWRDEIVVASDDLETLHQTIDRLEGRGPPETPPLQDSQAYGEIYGRVSPDLLLELLGGEQQALGQRLAEVARTIELHVDARDDVGMVVDVGGEESSEMQDLARSIAGAISLGRMTAVQEGEQDLAELLDLARVVPEGDRFVLELALPRALIERQLERCPARRGLDGGAASVPRVEPAPHEQHQGRGEQADPEAHQP